MSKISTVDVIAGNTATPDGVKGLIDHGADAVKDKLAMEVCVQLVLLQVVEFLN